MKQKVIPGGDKVDQYNKYDDIKRKLRELKKLEMKILRELIKIYHPDNGGDTTKFIEMMEHYKNNKN